VGTGAGNGPQKEWAKGMGPFIVADYGGLSHYRAPATGLAY